MRKLYKHSLSSKLSLDFFKESLDDSNLLSIEIIKFIEMQGGSFFTLLPKEADLEKLHQFTYGILPKMSRQKGPIGSLPGIYVYSEVPSLEKEFCKYLFDKIKENQFSCVIDDFNSTYTDQYTCDLFDKFGQHYEKDIYYFFDSINILQQNLLEVLYRSKTFWHSLCVLTKYQSSIVTNKSLNKKEIQEFCNQACLVMIGAYDGEGYIFWERTQ